LRCTEDFFHDSGQSIGGGGSDQLVWKKKPTFGYIPGHFSGGSGDRTVAFDRLIFIDAASLQSPPSSLASALVRNLGRLPLLDTVFKA